MSARSPTRPRPIDWRSGPLAALGAAWLVAGCGPSPGPPSSVTIAVTGEPQWYEGLQFEVGATDGSRWLFWPHEAVSIESFQLVSRAHVAGLRSENGGHVWQVENLETPGVTVGVRLEPAPDGLMATYEIRNASAVPHVVTIGPCLQLPDEFLAGVPEDRRADHVLVPTAERGWQWISSTHRTPGIADPLRRVEPRAWTQHYIAVRGHRHETMPHRANDGLNVFGVAEEHVAAGVIVAMQPGGRRLVAVGTDREAGVTYALLDCLHAVIQVEVPKQGVMVARYRVVFHEGAFPDLVSRIRDALDLHDLPQSASLPEGKGGAS